MTDAASSEHDLNGRAALVTGASRGLGYATAKALGARGAQVIAVARTVGGLEELDDAIRSAGGPAATLVPFDLNDHDAIDRLGAAIYERWGKLDLFAHAAAHAGMLGPAATMQPSEAQKYAAVNYIAVLRLIRALDPLFLLAEAPAAAFVIHRNAGRAHWAGYGASKAAGEAAAASYAAEAAKTRVLLFEPQPMGTALRMRFFPGEKPAQLAKPADEAAKLVDALCGESGGENETAS